MLYLLLVSVVASSSLHLIDATGWTILRGTASSGEHPRQNLTFVGVPYSVPTHSHKPTLKLLEPHAFSNCQCVD